ncbi:sodium:proton antiporter [Syntrophomonas wolfei]|uniref:Arsenic transporter family protein n=1 Tax=Syntrophomonas wolfei subsp. wolfei (strain DSM 2245B / Goettingen) TaxID=335541 RepID=Q0AUZ7_SYNWW|nr:ArsB/NhaD family transporter [Syntrophomonas wolfei]ABI69457.1 arsenic transporter family protein [Syntrophomonas wolfei subsp. wolfei str. Goettingen G311]
MTAFYLSIAIFLVTYIFIIFEKVHRTIIALVGAGLAIALGLLSQKAAIEYIDFNTLGLLIGMMIIVGITRRSGVFGYLAIKAARVAGGKPLRILVALAVVTAVLSAFLDNVTTVLLIVPVTFVLTDHLEVPAFPFLFAEILASNIGGTATLIGDPPNIMIGSATHLGFLDFIVNLAPIVIVIMIITLLCLVLMFRKDLRADSQKIESIMAMNAREEIRDWAILKKSLLVLGLTISAFFLHGFLHLETATIALLGAAILMLICAAEPEDILLAVEWPTIFFFAGLFIIVGAMEANGVMELLARQAMELTGGSLTATAVVVLWISAVFSAFVDNIPFVATMIPLLKTIGQMSGLTMDPIWWALSLGACLGGNGTLIGASANIIVAGISERHGQHIGFIDYLKYGFPLMLLSIAIANLYLCLFLLP